MRKQQEFAKELRAHKQLVAQLPPKVRMPCSSAKKCLKQDRAYANGLTSQSSSSQVSFSRFSSCCNKIASVGSFVRC